MITAGEFYFFMERSKTIFGNKISERVYRKALREKAKNIRKFGDDSNRNYPIHIQKNDQLGALLGVYDIRIEHTPGETFDVEKGLIVSSIRMGYGHYRISMAMASAASSMGYTPYWLDFNSFPETTAAGLINAQNERYSMGSRRSGNPIFDRLVWETMDYDALRALSSNALDQKNAELMVPIYRNIPKYIPVIGTHAWPAQAAVHAGMQYVVNAIPDSWPMATHLSEGSLHTVQCHNSYMGYRILSGMNGNKVCHPLPADSLVYTGHYVDHELVRNIEADCEARIRRRKNGEPLRFLLTIGGAGAQKEIFLSIIRHLLPSIREKKAALYVNVGDYKNVWDDLIRELPDMKAFTTTHFDDWQHTIEFAGKAMEMPVTGIHGFYHGDIIEAVYCTNMLMHSTDVLVTKPGELAYYPVPKLFIRRVGRHEMWGAVHSAEIGDGTLECRDIPHTIQMLDLFLQDEELLAGMCRNIVTNKCIGIYDGAYKAVKLAMSLKGGSTDKG